MVDDGEFCERLMQRVGVMVVPGGRCFGDGDDRAEGEGEGKREFAGYVRIGFVNETEIVRKALEEWRRFMYEEFEGVLLVGEKE